MSKIVNQSSVSQSVCQLVFQSINQLVSQSGPDNACKHANVACRQGPIFVGKKGRENKKNLKKWEKKEKKGAKEKKKIH